MVGEEDPSDPDSFARHSVLKRLVVLSAGSIMNFVLPVVIFTIMLMLPHDALVGGSVTDHGSVAPGSPAEQAGLRGGDAILAVDGKPVISPGELVETVRGRSGQPIELSLRRASRVMGLSQSPELATFDAVNVTPRISPPRLKVVEEVTDPSSEVGLSDARRYNPDLEVGDTMTQGAIGVMIGPRSTPSSARRPSPMWSAVPNSVGMIWAVLSFTWGGITEGVATRSNPGIAGPVGIAHATG